MFCFFLLFSSSRIRYPEAVKSFRCVKFVKSQVEIYGPSRRWASAFRLYRSNQTHTAAYMHNRLHAKTVRMVIFSGSYFENEWSLDLWSLVETCSAQENIACEASSMISVISDITIPCSVRARTMPYFFLSWSTETPMTLLELLRVFGNFCCVCETVLLIVFDPIFNVVQHRH